MRLPISQVIKRLRKEKNVTQEELAKVLNVTYQSVSRWENDLAYPDVELIPLIANYFGSSVQEILDDLFQNAVYPIVYAYINGEERFSYVPELCTRGMKMFLNTRKGDIRTNIVASPLDLKDGNIFYITCIDTPEKLRPLYEKYRDKYHCVYERDIYTKEQWLEIMPLEASKSHAVKQLQAMLKCDKIIVFGDGKNDIDMFRIADESYAVANAHEDLKKCATDIILSNNDDGVAKWLLDHFK